MSEEIYNMNKDYQAKSGWDLRNIVILVLFDWLDAKNNKR